MAYLSKYPTILFYYPLPFPSPSLGCSEIGAEHKKVSKGNDEFWTQWLGSGSVVTMDPFSYI